MCHRLPIIFWSRRTQGKYSSLGQPTVLKVTDIPLLPSCRSPWHEFPQNAGRLPPDLPHLILPAQKSQAMLAIIEVLPELRVLPKQLYADMLPDRLHGHQRDRGKSGCLSEMPASARGQGRRGPGPTALALAGMSISSYTDDAPGQTAVVNSAGALSLRPRALHLRRAQAVWRAGWLSVGMEPSRCPRARCRASAPRESPGHGRR
jgi:hypothetical protein